MTCKEMSCKNRIYRQLKAHNFFEYKKPDSLEVLKKEQLENVIIEVGRLCNEEFLFFKYNPVTQQFCRIIRNEEDSNLLNRESLYYIPQFPKCEQRQCFSKAISIDAFINLLSQPYEPVAVYTVGEFNSK